MALGDNNYNPKHVAINNPMTNADLFPNKTLTPGTAGDLNTSSILVPHINENPLGYEDIKTIEGKYNFDISSVTAIRHKEMFPILFAADMNAKATNTGGDIHVIAEDCDQDVMFHDTQLVKLRIASQGSGGNPLAINSSSKRGGKLIWRALDTGMSTKFATAYTGTEVTDLTNGTTVTETAKYDYTLETLTLNSVSRTKIMTLGWRLKASSSDEESQSLGGSNAIVFCSKMAALLDGNKYYKLGVTNAIKESTSETAWFGYSHVASATQPVSTVHSLFEDLAIVIDGTQYQLHEVAVRITAFYWRADYTQFVMMLDFGYANLEEPLGTTNIVLMEEVQSHSTNFTNGFTRLSDHALLGMYLGVPAPVVQGGDITNDLRSGYLYDIQTKENFTQIIQSEQMRISGTYLASQNRLKLNQAQKMRDRMMFDFKTRRRNVQLFGSGASRKRSSTNIVNTSAGLFDYQMNPIRYMKMTLNRYSAATTFESVYEFIKNYARAIFAFKPQLQNSGTINVYCSKWFLQHIDIVIKLGYQEYGNQAGFNTGYQPLPGGNTLDLGIKFSDVRTPYGTLRFTVDPGLDYMTEMYLPYFVGTDINPKHMLLALDTSKMSTVSLRAPRLRGNIQSPSADYVMEDMICEETFELLDPLSHAVTMVSLR